MAKSIHSNKSKASMTRTLRSAKQGRKRQSNWTSATSREIKTRRTLDTRCAAMAKSHSKKALRISKEVLRKIISWTWIWWLLISILSVSLHRTQDKAQQTGDNIIRALKSSLLSTSSTWANKGHQALQNRQILTRINSEWLRLTISILLLSRTNLTELSWAQKQQDSCNNRLISLVSLS